MVWTDFVKDSLSAYRRNNLLIAAVPYEIPVLANAVTQEGNASQLFPQWWKEVTTNSMCT
jgi:hypothetical protein